MYSQGPLPLRQLIGGPTLIEERNQYHRLSELDRLRNQVNWLQSDAADSRVVIANLRRQVRHLRERLGEAQDNDGDLVVDLTNDGNTTSGNKPPVTRPIFDEDFNIQDLFGWTEPLDALPNGWGSNVISAATADTRPAVPPPKTKGSSQGSNTANTQVRSAVRKQYLWTVLPCKEFSTIKVRRSYLYKWNS